MKKQTGDFLVWLFLFVAISLAILVGVKTHQRNHYRESRAAAVKAVKTPAPADGETLKLDYASTGGSVHWPTHMTLPSATPTPTSTPKPDPGNLNDLSVTLAGGAKQVLPGGFTPTSSTLKK